MMKVVEATVKLAKAYGQGSAMVKAVAHFEMKRTVEAWAEELKRKWRK